MMLSELKYEPRKLQLNEKYLGVQTTDTPDFNLKHLTAFNQPVIIEKSYGKGLTVNYLIANKTPEIASEPIETREQFLENGYLTYKP